MIQTLKKFSLVLLLAAAAACGVAPTENGSGGVAQSERRAAVVQDCGTHNTESVNAYARVAGLIETEEQRAYAFGDSTALHVARGNIELRDAVVDMKNLATTRDVVCAERGTDLRQPVENYFWFIDSLSGVNVASFEGQMFVSQNIAIFCDLAGARLLNDSRSNGDSWEALGLPVRTAQICAVHAP